MALVFFFQFLLIVFNLSADAFWFSVFWFLFSYTRSTFPKEKIEALRTVYIVLLTLEKVAAAVVLVGGK